MLQEINFLITVREIELNTIICSNDMIFLSYIYRRLLLLIILYYNIIANKFAIRNN